jgi:hypothetical protein
MPISVSMIVVSSKLAVAVADRGAGVRHCSQLQAGLGRYGGT